MEVSNQPPQKLFTVAFFMIGAGLLLAAGVSALLDYRFISRASKVEGEVVRIDRLNASTTIPTVQFIPAGETEAIEFFGNHAPDYNKYKVGDRVTVLYIQADKSSFRVQPRIYSLEEALYLHELFLMFLGIGMLRTSLAISQQN